VKTPIPKLSAPANRALANEGIACLEDLAKYSEKQIAALHGMGPNAMGRLKTAMAEANVSFTA